jgi:hypothetical protein
MVCEDSKKREWDMAGTAAFMCLRTVMLVTAARDEIEKAKSAQAIYCTGEQGEERIERKRIVLPISESRIGAYYGGPQGARIGYAVGSCVGGFVDPTVVLGPQLPQ